MKAFISWSGDRSRAVADAIAPWLKKQIQALEPWISSGMQKGSRWPSEVGDQLEQSKAGVICLTRDNVDEPWILFEAGALSKTKGSRLFTLLLDMGPTDIAGPLALFQHTKAERDEVWKLVKDLNELVGSTGERVLAETELREMFDLLWPGLERQLATARGAKVAAPPRRSERELLEEILAIVRADQQHADSAILAANVLRNISAGSGGLGFPQGILGGSGSVTARPESHGILELAKTELQREGRATQPPATEQASGSAADRHEPKKGP